jgi:hypothetical protein
MTPFWTATVNAFIRTVTLPVFLPSGEIILASQEAQSPYPLIIDLPAFGSVEVLLTLDETYENITMDGPDDYTGDTQGLLPWPGADCVINGAADGEFTDINTEPLIGYLTIAIDSVDASPGGACSILKRPAPGACDFTVNLNAGFPQ